MDRNSVTGLILITLILIGFWIFNKPSQQEIEEMRARQDSIRIVQLKEQEERIANQLQNQASQSAEFVQQEKQLADSNYIQQIYGIMSPFINSEVDYTTLENDKIKITFSNKGGKIYSVELKDFKTHNEEPLILFDGDNNKFGFSFTHNTRIYNTNDLFFNIKSKTENSIVYSLGFDEHSELSFEYVLPEDEYMTQFSIESKNLAHLLSTPRGRGIDIEWYMEMPAFEKGRSFEKQYSGIYFKFDQDDVDWLKQSKDDNKDLRTKVKWIGYKSQFFSTVFIANDIFTSASIKAEMEKNENSPFLQYNTSEIALPLDFQTNKKIDFNFFFGPNHFYTLNGYDKDLDLTKLIRLGWGILGWINRYAVIPIFNFLERSISSYGVIILLLTIIIKLVLFPFTYKSYISTAKMKVLKPQIDEINAKIPKEKAAERQQATMNLYKKAGVNPMGGCLPMLLQMPILIAMFRFFPASIELRQKSFLWATDLSSYDSILDLPFSIPLYGAHISLFTLLMAATNIIYTKMNSEMQASNQMPGMKTMMYMMPVMFLFIFNGYASGLSYYYFISTLITIGQTYFIRLLVDDKKILAQLNANQKKPTKKSKFAQRLEEMTKQQQQMQKQAQKRKK